VLIVFPSIARQKKEENSAGWIYPDGHCAHGVAATAYAGP